MMMMMHSLGINGDGKSRGQPANVCSLGKIAIEKLHIYVHMCVCL